MRSCDAGPKRRFLTSVVKVAIRQALAVKQAYFARGMCSEPVDLDCLCASAAYEAATHGLDDRRSPAPGNQLQKHILRGQAVAAQRRSQRPDRARPQLPSAPAQAGIQRATRAGRIGFTDRRNGMQARHLQAIKLLS